MTHNQDITDKIAAMLAEDDRLLVPVRDILARLSVTSPIDDGVLDAIIHDERFYLHSSSEVAIGDMLRAEADETEKFLQAVGVDFGPKLMLKSKAPNAESLLREAAKELKIIRSALQQAYKHRTSNNPALKEKLIAAAKKAQQIEQELVKLFVNLPNTH